MAKPAKKYEDLNEEEKAKYDKWMARSESMTKGGQAAMGMGCSMMIIGLVLTVVVAVLLMLIL